MTGWRWNLARVGFVVAVTAGAWWSWHDSGDELRTALGRVGAAQVVPAGLLVLAGLLLTGWAWWVAMGAFDVEGAPVRMVAQFFVAQLGKYVPGSVWAFAAQGAISARHGTPPRVAAAGTVLFLGLHVASGLLLVGAFGWWTSLPWWLVVTCLLVGSVGLAPGVHRALGRRLSGRPVQWGPRRSLVGALVMAPAWGCYTLALLVLVPDPSASLVLTLGCAFAVAFASGVAVPIAPAGLGARDGVLLVLLTPALGAGPAGMVAVVARLLHTVADFLLASAGWVVARTSAPRRPPERDRGDH